MPAAGPDLACSRVGVGDAIQGLEAVEPHIEIFEAPQPGLKRGFEKLAPNLIKVKNKIGFFQKKKTSFNPLFGYFSPSGFEQILLIMLAIFGQSLVQIGLN